MTHTEATAYRRALGLQLAGLLLATAVLAGCSTAPSWQTDLRMAELVKGPPPDAGPSAPIAELARMTPGAERATYRIGARDELTITAWGSKDVWADVTAQPGQTTQAVVVQDDGTVVLPLLRRQKVGGLTLNEALTKIADAYGKELGVSFQVDGRISQHRSRTILLDGPFNKPGLAFLSPDVMTLGEAITGIGGGIASNADPRQGVLFRGGNRYSIDLAEDQASAGDLANVLLQDGDRIYFPSRSLGTGTYYVFGEVYLQGAYGIPAGGISLLQGLATARGPVIPTANMESIYLVRSEAQQPKIYQLTMQQMMETAVPLLPEDRLFVPPTGLTNWERTLRQLLPLFGSAFAAGAGVSEVAN